MLLRNPRAVHTAYPADLKALMNLEQAQQGRRWLGAWDGLTPGATPLHELPGLARRLGVARLSVKDESLRSPLGSFKTLGAPIALVRQVLRLHPAFDPARLLAGAYGQALAGYTAISATDGNHGRALAAACRSVGCRCVIVLHAHVGAEREAAIAVHGAHIVRIAGDYDASVAEAARLAAAHGWQVVSDTSYAGYEDIPRDVMQGYAVLALEVAEQTAGQPPFTHVVVQGGVGGLAAGLVSALWEQHGAQRPCVVVAEPQQADCLLQSARQGRPARATGSVDSVMAGLACGETSPLAWRFLQPGVDAFMTLDDEQAVQAMRGFAAGGDGDIPIVAGESGAASLAALQALCADAAMARAVDLGGQSRVLLINTEGATAPEVYRELVGESAQAVRQRQAAWRAGAGLGAA